MDDTPAIRVIVSDFGGVICAYDYRIFCRRLGQRLGLDAEAIYAGVYGGALHVEFERGRLSGPGFHRQVGQWMSGTFMTSSSASSISGNHQDCMPQRRTVPDSIDRNTTFSTSKPMTITVNRPAKTLGISSWFLFS